MEKPDNGVENSLSGSFFETQITEEQKAEIWKGILCSDTFLNHKRPEIAGYFQMEQNTILQMEYLQNCFPENTYFSLNVADRDIGFHAGEDGLYVNMTGKAGVEHEEMLSWNDARYLLNSYIEDGVYLLPGEVAEQIDTNGMYQQLDLFSMCIRQKRLAYRMWEARKKRQRRRSYKIHKNVIEKNGLIA